MRRVMGITLFDRLRSEDVLEKLKASKLSELVEERQLRYLGHVWRYNDGRWTKFALQAQIAGQRKQGKARQYRKVISKLLKKKGLTTQMMEQKDVWAAKLKELYPRGKDNVPNATDSANPPQNE